jgi:hypothetical protein
MACDAEQCQEVGGVAGVAVRCSGDGVAAVETQDADGEVAQAGHGPGSVAGADLAGVLGEGRLAEVVQRLDAPIPSDLVGPSSLESNGWPKHRDEF